jgi:hypothetical protein
MGEGWSDFALMMQLKPGDIGTAKEWNFVSRLRVMIVRN